MTSLPLDPAKGYYRLAVPEWGTDKPKEKMPLWSAKAPTWHVSGEPTHQYYDLTLLKKSNVRLNDQLLPKPQESTMGEKMIHLPFPADHPYASHISKQKVFPSFANTSEDPKRGVEALNTLPLSSETPAAGYDIQIVHKTKGHPNRHEVQALPPSSLKRGLTWHGELGFHHGVKAHGDRQPYYPIPPSSTIPNLTSRHASDQAMSDHATNVTRNLERQQWKTTYERNHTGIGPANQYKLDNLDDKREYKTVTGQEDDDIYPWFHNTYEPARPQEGRLAIATNPNYGIPKSHGAAQEDTGYVRKPTLTEKEEYRLLNGTEYANLPTPQAGKDNQWKEWSSINNSEERFAALIERQMRNAPDPLPFIERGTEPLNDKKKGSYMDELSKEHHENIQQIEAENRWRKLDNLKPSSDIAVLDRKLAISTPKEQVPAFYGHEGKYNEERAGLYLTTYDPAKLSYKLDDDKGKLNMRNTVGSHVDAVHYPTDLNIDADLIRTGLETDTRKVPMFSDRPDIYEVFEPFKRDRAVRLTQLQPTIDHARPRIQEGEVLNTDSTMGNSYNHEKFLQEYVLNSHSRSEPLALMSKQNQNLQNVRINATKQVKFNDQITVGEGAGNAPLVIGKASIESPKMVMFSPQAPAPRVVKAAPSILSQSLPIPPKQTDEFQSMIRSSEAFRPSSSMSRIKEYKSASPTDSENLFLSQRGQFLAQNQFDSKASNLGIGGASYNQYKSSYDNQFSRADSSRSRETDPRYDWEPGCGVPRPQTSLIKLQNSFSKSAAHRRLRESFPEKNPNLIDNVHLGRKHEFKGMNAQVLRGTLVTA